jgi:hypothetical protein
MGHPNNELVDEQAVTDRPGGSVVVSAGMPGMNTSAY